MTYRSDVDGLRAIAVLLVMLYHFGSVAISGGFIGVDVFFVISGFLITSIIVKQKQSGTFSMKEFYVRRIKRLAPALLVMLAISFVMLSLLMAPSDIEKMAKSVIYITTYLGNFFFWQEYGGYFASEIKEAPFLHTWSLAVEEQFYFVWPITLVLALGMLSLKNIAVATGIITLLAIAVSEYATQVTVGAAYYLLPTRAFEMLIGASLALLMIVKPIKLNQAATPIAAIGLMMIIASALVIDKSTPFPGLNALYPTVGAAFVLFAAHQSPLINRMLSVKPMVYVGLISYSLYLWHWPLTALINYIEIEKTVPVQALLFIATFSLAHFSYRFVEQPARNTKLSLKRLYAFPSLAVLIVCFVTLTQDGFRSLFNPETLKVEQALNAHSNEIRAACHASLSNYDSLPVDECKLGTSNAEIQGFLIGDSHANHYTAMLDELAKNDNVAIQDYTLDQCPPLLDLNWGKSPYKAQACANRNQQAFEYVKHHDIDMVILAASWPNERANMIYDPNTGEKVVGMNTVKERLDSSLRNTVQAYLDANIEVVILTDTPFLVDASARCPLKKALFNNNTECTVVNSPNTFMDNIFSDLAAMHGSVRVIQPRELLCDDKQCAMILKGTALYRDQDHLNDVGSRLIGSELVSSGVSLLKPVHNETQMGASE